MSRFHSYLISAGALLAGYSGTQPFASEARRFFSLYKKIGSRDRKEILNLCYAYFRAGRLFESDTVSEKVVKSFFLCTDKGTDLLKTLKPGWEANASLGYTEKLTLLNAKPSLQGIFPWSNELSDGIEEEKFRQSFLRQPILFIRIRPGMNDIVLNKLTDSGINYKVTGDNCIALQNGFDIGSLLQLNKEVVIQDQSSQQTGELLTFVKEIVEKSVTVISVWDCCAASGGKSIMAADLLGSIRLTVSDIRESILHNLQKRLKEAGVKVYHSFKADLTNDSVVSNLPEMKYDLIIADVPCTGSGTWARTPEQLFYFNIAKINHYQSLQRMILNNVIPSLKPGGFFLYITCSVFSAENEMQVSYMKEKFSLRSKRQELIKGYDKGADTMFVALLQKPL